ncbi:MAG: DUF3089 domain-containing protein [Sphingomicrobium sp.]
MRAVVGSAILAIAGALIVWPAQAPAQAPTQARLQATTSRAVDYARPANWLCLPGRSDVCSAPGAATWLNPGGYGAPVPARGSGDPAVDCFYVYPTVSNDAGMNSDLVVGGEEKFAAQSQFARFGSVCRTFAPVYRQMTVSAIASMAFGGDIKASSRTAYGDVANAWRTYLSRYNQGRPFVLVGHSQGSALLIQLIAREIEGTLAAKRMMLAILPGYNILVPTGKLVGGSFKSTPLCSSPGERGCVISWTSFRDRNPPPQGAMFGIADQPGMTVACVNPAMPGSRSWEPLSSYWYARSGNAVPGGPIAWSSEGPPPTPYLRTDGLVSGKCITDGSRGYLSIRTNHGPADRRTDHIGGEIAVFGMFLPGWGMHLSDIPEAQGDLIRAVSVSLRAGTAARRVR